MLGFWIGAFSLLCLMAMAGVAVLVCFAVVVFIESLVRLASTAIIGWFLRKEKK